MRRNCKDKQLMKKGQVMGPRLWGTGIIQSVPKAFTNTVNPGLSIGIIGA